jgi:hypothetical protein
MMPKPAVPPAMTAAQWAEAYRSGKYRDETCAIRPLEWFFEQAMRQAVKQVLTEVEITDARTP